MAYKRCSGFTQDYISNYHRTQHNRRLPFLYIAMPHTIPAAVWCELAGILSVKYGVYAPEHDYHLIHAVACNIRQLKKDIKKYGL